MSQNTISKPSANPLLAAILAALFRLGFVYCGQMQKWPIFLLVETIGWMLCFLPGIFIWVLGIIDAYQTAQRLQSGESIPENEYTLPLLYSIVKLVDKTATCSRAQPSA